MKKSPPNSTRLRTAKSAAVITLANIGSQLSSDTLTKKKETTALQGGSAYNGQKNDASLPTSMLEDSLVRYQIIYSNEPKPDIEDRDDTCYQEKEYAEEQRNRTLFLKEVYIRNQRLPICKLRGDYNVDVDDLFGLR